MTTTTMEKRLEEAREKFHDSYFGNKIEDAHRTLEITLKAAHYYIVLLEIALKDTQKQERDGKVSVMEGRRILTKLGWTRGIGGVGEHWCSPEKAGPTISTNLASALERIGYELIDN